MNRNLLHPFAHLGAKLDTLALPSKDYPSEARDHLAKVLGINSLLTDGPLGGDLEIDLFTATSRDALRTGHNRLRTVVSVATCAVFAAGLCAMPLSSVVVNENRTSPPVVHDETPNPQPQPEPQATYWQRTWQSNK